MKELGCFNTAVWSLTMRMAEYVAPDQDERRKEREGIYTTLPLLSCCALSPTAAGCHRIGSMRGHFTLLSLSFLASAQQHFQ